MDHGTFLGWIGDDVLHSLYRIADVCVVPSIYEPFGLVALEAMASGCPCIVADTGGLREVVPHNEAGLRFRARDPEALGEMVERAAHRRRAARPPRRRGLRARAALRLGRRRPQHRGRLRRAGRRADPGLSDLEPLATIRRRHASQRLAGEPLSSVAEAVRWSGAVQGQEFAEVKWSLSERTAGSPPDAEVERAFAEGEILRTHVMRPTWHVVAAEDIRWLLRLTAPRVHQANGYAYRRTELDGPTLARAHRVLAGALADGGPRTRKELVAALAAAGSRATRCVSATSSATRSSSS